MKNSEQSSTHICGHCKHYEKCHIGFYIHYDYCNKFNKKTFNVSDEECNKFRKYQLYEKLKNI